MNRTLFSRRAFYRGEIRRALERIARWQPLLLPAVAVLFAGCHSIGPETVARDRFDYSSAISDSWKRQTLLNIVKLRYLDPPIFVDVGQIVSGYTLETGVTGGVSLPQTTSFGGNTVTAGGSAKFTDRPTITYVPLTGTKFIAGLMTPLPPWALFHAMGAGWAADTILTLGATNINGLSGESASISGVSHSDAKFVRVTQLMRSLQDSGMVSVRVVEDDDKKRATLITLRSDDISDEALAQSRELRELLHLDHDATEFKLVYGSAARSNREVAVATRSLIKVLGMLSTHVEIPSEDLAAGRATPGQDNLESRKLHFYSGKDEPKDAFVSVHYRGHWFWIDDRDLYTKRAFALIMLLFTMADTGENNDKAVLTIPTG